MVRPCLKQTNQRTDSFWRQHPRLSSDLCTHVYLSAFLQVSSREDCSDTGLGQQEVLLTSWSFRIPGQPWAFLKCEFLGTKTISWVATPQLARITTNYRIQKRKVCTFRDFPRTTDVDGLRLCSPCGRWCHLCVGFLAINCAFIRASVVLLSGGLFTRTHSHTHSHSLSQGAQPNVFFPSCPSRFPLFTAVYQICYEGKPVTEMLSCLQSHPEHIWRKSGSQQGAVSSVVTQESRAWQRDPCWTVLWSEHLQIVTALIPCWEKHFPV